MGRLGLRSVALGYLLVVLLGPLSLVFWRTFENGFGATVYARFRACDDSRKNVSITERDSKPGVPSYTRRFRTLVPPRTCAALTRHWLPAPRFRHGRYTLTLTARDFAGLTSRPVSRTFFR